MFSLQEYNLNIKFKSNETREINGVVLEKIQVSKVLLELNKHNMEIR